jgi:hypothetical protein
MRVDFALASAALIVAASSFATLAWAEGYDGTYIGKSRMTSQSYQASGARVNCKPEYDIKITIRGTSLTGENLSIGGKATGTVQKDGTYTAQGGLGTLTQASSQGQVQGNVLRGTFTQVSNGATCTGTLEATRQP